MPVTNFDVDLLPLLEVNVPGSHLWRLIADPAVGQWFSIDLDSREPALQTYADGVLSRFSWGEEAAPLDAQRIFAGSVLRDVLCLQIEIVHRPLRQDRSLRPPHFSGGKLSREPRSTIQSSEERCRYDITFITQELRSRHKRDLCVGKFRFDSVHYRNCVRGPTVVIAEQISGLVSEGAYDSDLASGFLERQSAVILEQDHRFVGDRPG